MGKERITFSPTHHTLFPTLTLTLTFHHPEQSLLHKLHWLDHVIRVGVFSVSVFMRARYTPHHPTLNLKVSPNPKLSVYRSMW